MHGPTAVIPLPTSSASSEDRPRVPRCARTRLTKPECHCPACLLEQIAAHGPVASARREAGAVGPAPAGAIL